MKNFYKICLASGVALSLNDVAHAQSSVTLYGIIDVGVNYASNSGGKKLYSVSSGINNGSRFGFKGSEDLGGGLKAIFTLENGFDVASGKLGNGGLMFGRQAFVGIDSSKFGTLTFGRQYSQIADYTSAFEIGNMSAGSTAAHPGDLDNLNNSFRINNSIKYASPTINGFSAGALFGFGGVAGDFSRNKIYSLGGRYAYGPFSAGVAYLSAQNPNVSMFGNSSQTALTAATTNVTTPVYSGFMSARTYNDLAVGAMYEFGKTIVAGTYSHVAFKDIGDTSSGPNPNKYSGTAAFDSGELNIRYRVSPALVVGIAYNYTHGGAIQNKANAIYQQGSAMATYSLSKRTDVYVIGSYQHASGVDSRNMKAVAATNNVSASTADNQTFVRVGLRQKF